MTLQEYNDLYKLPVRKSMTITSSGGVTITNTNIVSEKMSLEKSLCSDDNLRYGRCEAACFKITIADVNHNFTNEWLTVVQDVQTDNNGYLLTEGGSLLLTEDGEPIFMSNEEIIEAQAVLGQFRVHSDKPTNDRRWRELTCYDMMYEILNADVASWYRGLTFPMTIKNLRDSFFTYLGITQETTTLCNDSFVTAGGFSVVGVLSGKTIIEAICEFNGVFGQITPSGTFEYVSLIDADTLTLDYYIDGTGSYEDYTTAVITGINARGTASDVGTFVGTDTNVYVLVGNPLIFGTEGTSALETALANLLDQIGTDTFRPFEVQTYGNPMLPLGTQLTIVTRNQTIVSNVIRKTMTGIQALRDRYITKSEKQQPPLVNNVTNDVIRTKGKVHELEIDVNGLTSRVSATETSLANNYSTTTQTESMITQSESEILTTVSQTYVTQTDYTAEIQILQDQIDGRIEYFDGNVVPTLNNAPANSWTTAAAKDSHIGDLYRYHYTEQGVDKTDYYRFDKDTTTNPATYSWVVLGQSDVDEALRKAELANQKADAAQLELDQLELDIPATYETISSASATATSLQSQITQSAGQIVLKTYTDGNNIKHMAEVALTSTPSAASEFKVSADNISFIANKKIELSSNDLEINSTYFKVASDGSLSCTRGKIASWDINPFYLGSKYESGNNYYWAYMQAFTGSSLDRYAFAIDTYINGYLSHPFYVSYNGKLYANNAEIAGKITATSGKIANWDINPFYFGSKYETGNDYYWAYIQAFTGSNTGRYAFAIDTKINGTVSSPFYITYDGSLFAKKAYIEGTIRSNNLTAVGATVSGTITSSNLTATGGTVGGWTIANGRLYAGNSTDKVVVLQASAASYNDWAIGAGGSSIANYDDCPFRVTRGGTVVARSLLVSYNNGKTYDILNSENLVWITSNSTTGGTIRLADDTGSYSILLNGEMGRISCDSISCDDLFVSDYKSRVVKTEDYGSRLVYCYETPSPMFGDIGEGKIAEDGKCYVWLDSTFSETIKTQSYQVFLQKYGQGECYVTERTERYFIVEGTPDMSFGWEIKARQAGKENMRLEVYNEDDFSTKSINYGAEAINHLNDLKNEREVA